MLSLHREVERSSLVKKKKTVVDAVACEADLGEYGESFP
jgi:hypothetical protein